MQGRIAGGAERKLWQSCISPLSAWHCARTVHADCTTSAERCNCARICGAPGLAIARVHVFRASANLPWFLSWKWQYASASAIAQRSMVIWRSRRIPRSSPASESPVNWLSLPCSTVHCLLSSETLGNLPSDHAFSKSSAFVIAALAQPI